MLLLCVYNINKTWWPVATKIKKSSGPIALWLGPRFGSSSRSIFLALLRYWPGTFPARTASVEAFDFMGNKKQAEARVARIIRRNWGLTCAFSWASHKISALHRLNSRSAGLIQIAEEMEYDQQIDDNPAVLYDQAGSEEEC